MPKTDTTMKPTPTTRIAAFALAIVLSVLTLGLAVPGGALFLAGKVMPDAGDAFETIADARAVSGKPTEVAIMPGTIEVTGIREQHTASDANARPHG